MSVCKESILVLNLFHNVMNQTVNWQLIHITLIVVLLLRLNVLNLFKLIYVNAICDITQHYQHNIHTFGSVSVRNNNVIVANRLRKIDMITTNWMIIFKKKITSSK